MNNININTNYGLISDLPADVQDVTRRHTVYRCLITKGEGNYSFSLSSTKGTVFLRVTGISKLQLLFLMTTYNLGYFCEFLTDEQLKSYVEYVLGQKTYEEHITA